MAGPTTPDRPAAAAAVHGIPRWGWWLVVGAAAALAGVLVAGLWHTTWYPVHDHAFAELRMRDLGGPHTPLVGAYSRFGWSHPGPLLTVLLGLGYRLGGSTSVATLATAAVLNATALAAAVLLAWRRGGPPLAALTGVILAVLANSLGADFLVNPWNPYVPVLLLVTLVLACWSVALGDVPMAVPAVATGSLVVQAHVGFSPVAAVALAGAGLGAALAARRGVGTGTRSGRWWVAAGLLGVVLWLPPLVDQVAGSGNLAALARYFAGTDTATGGPAETEGWGRGAGLAATELALHGPWSGAGEPLEPFTGVVARDRAWSLVWPVTALSVAAILARRRGPPGAGVLVGLVAALALTTLVALSRISGGAFDYVVRWTWAVAALVWLTVAWVLLTALWSILAPRLGPAAPQVRRAVLAGAALVVVAATASMDGLTDPSAPEADRSALVAELAAGAVPPLTEVGEPVLLRPVDQGEGFPAPSGRQLAAGLALQLERAGVAVRVIDQDWAMGPGSGGARMFDDHRAAAGPTAGTVTVASGSALEAVDLADDAVVLVRVEDPEVAAELAGLSERLRTAFEEGGRPDLAAAVGTSGLGWLFLDADDLAIHADDVRRLLDLQERPRAAVWWTPAPGTTG